MDSHENIPLSLRLPGATSPLEEWSVRYYTTLLNGNAAVCRMTIARRWFRIDHADNVSRGKDGAVSRRDGPGLQVVIAPIETSALRNFYAIARAHNQQTGCETENCEERSKIIR
jgi:hypothetical protein